MDAMEAILTRRSIRVYTEQPVDDRSVEELLRAAMAAPSASNKQPWQFVVIRDRSTLDAIPQFHPYAQMLKNAQLAILVCGDSTFQDIEGYQIVDCAAATQNILLAAHARGLGAVWLGIYPRETRIADIRKLLNLPKHILPVSLVSIGWPGEQKPAADRYNTDRIHQDKW